MEFKEYLKAHRFFPYAALAVFILILYLCLSPFIDFSGSGTAGGFSARIFMAAGIAAAALAACILIIRRKMTAFAAGVLITLCGIVMRLGYMLYTPYFERGHDVGSLTGNGHLGYIYTIYSTFRLPQSGNGQFYHPPLSYLIDALTARFYSFLTGSCDLTAIMESTRLVPCFASCALLIVCWRLFDELKFDRTAQLTAMTLISFSPTFFILSASINNDMLMIFLFMTALLYTVRYYNSPSFKNIVLLAVSSGCAMMTKFSGGLIAGVTGIVFIIMLIKRRSIRRFFRLFGQMALYAVIFLTLGLWYSARNFCLFGQPLGYVLQIDTNTLLYTGNRSVAERFFSFPLGELLDPLYCRPYGDFRLWIYTVKCSLFGEFSFPEDHNLAATVLIALNVILILMSIAAMICVFVRRRENEKTGRRVMLGVWLLLLLSFIYFNIKYPFACTMDFRYIVPTAITGAAFLGLASSRIKRGSGLASKSLFFLIGYFIAAFSLFSVIFYVI